MNRATVARTRSTIGSGLILDDRPQAFSSDTNFLWKQYDF